MLSQARTRPIVSPLPRVSFERLIVATLTVCGGGLLIIGTLLPWLSLFAGLQSYPGIAGVYGRILMVLGALTLLGGLTYLVTGLHQLRWGLGWVGFAALGISGWALREAFSLTGARTVDAMLVPSVGSGLWICVLAALLVSGTWLVGSKANDH